MLLTAKQKEYVKIHGFKVSVTAIAIAILLGILGILLYVIIRYSNPAGWSDYVNTKFITTTLNLAYLYGSLILFILFTGGYNALKNCVNFETEEARKYSTAFLALLAVCTTYICSLGI